ncbi:MAG: sugar phosphate isomerase/epimerase family protein [Planctomycetaceae bacterium]
MVSPILNRRHFLSTSFATAAAVALSQGSALTAFAAEKAPLFKISLAQWSLHKAFFEKKIDNLDFAKIAKEEFGIEAIEYVNQFFKDKATNAEYLAGMKKRAADHGVRSLLIMVDGEGALGDADETKRQKAVDNHKKWLDAASTLGCHSIRVNAQSSGTYDEQMDRAADGLSKLTLLAEQQNLNVIVENHGGLSSNADWLVGVMQQVDHPHCGTLPDFGNFGINRDKDEWFDFYKGVELMMPYAQAVSAKTHDFDDARPLVTVNTRWKKEFDFLKMMQIVTAAGYRGYVGIEYEGTKLDEYAGVCKTKQMLETCLAELSKS